MTAAMRFSLFTFPSSLQSVHKQVLRLQQMSAKGMFVRKTSRFLVGVVFIFFCFSLYFILHSHTLPMSSSFTQTNLPSATHHSFTSSASVTTRFSFPSPRPKFYANQTAVIIIASREHQLFDVQLTFSSIVSHNRYAQVQLVHFSNTSDARFAALVPDYRQVYSRRPYDNPLQALAPESPSTLLIVAGTVLAPRALHWLEAARKVYADRPDVAAFSLDAVIPVLKNQDLSNSNLNSTRPDYDPNTWIPVGPLPPNDAFIFRSCPLASTIMFNNQPPHFHPWLTFYEWITARRSDTFRFPSGPGIDNTPLSMKGLTQRDWTPATWNIWFSQFLHQYHIGVVYPNVEGALAQNEKILPSGAFPKQKRMYHGRGRWKLGEDIATYLGNGNLIPLSYFSSETIENLVDLGDNQQKVISFTMVNNHFINMSLSWLCNVDVADFRPKGLVWGATDDLAYKVLSSDHKSRAIRLNEIQGGKDTGHDFGNPGYWKLMLERTELITEILKHGIAIFAFETDAIWLEDPMPHIEKLLADDADLVGTINSRFEISGNFFYLRPSLPTRRLWIEITERFQDAYNKANFEDKKADSWTYIQNDQSLLTNLVLRNNSWRRAHPLSFMTLNLERFVDGKWYDAKDGLYATKGARYPIVINNNFVVGTQAKISRAKKHGHWFLDDKTNACLDDVVDAAVRDT